LRLRILLAFTPLLLYLCVICVDYTSLHLYSWRRGCEVEVFDPYGYAKGVLSECYYDVMTLADYIHLGETDAKTIVIVTHFFTSPSGEVGLGTSEEIQLYYPLVHPVRAFHVVKGILPGRMYASAPPRVFKDAHLVNKTIVLLTCRLPRIEEVVEAFLGGGARLVIVSNTPALQPSEARRLLELVLNSLSDVKRLCATELFTCYGDAK